MRLLLAAMILLGLSCIEPIVQPIGGCCAPTAARRGFGYTGTSTADGGASTQVQVIVGSNGQTTVSFLRGNDQVVQTFRTSIR